MVIFQSTNSRGRNSQHIQRDLLFGYPVKDKDGLEIFNTCGIATDATE